MNKLALAIGMAVILTCTGSVVHAKPTDAQKCSASKRKCGGKGFLAIMKCQAKAALAGTDADPACLSKAHDAFIACFNLAEAKGGCVVTFPAEHIDQDLTDWTDDMTGDMPPS